MALARAMRSVDVVAGDVVIRQGEQGDRLYVTESGLYDMSQNGEIKGVPIGAFQVSWCYVHNAEGKASSSLVKTPMLAMPCVRRLRLVATV